ncbi:MAG: glycosyltransferase [bacterium]
MRLSVSMIVRGEESCLSACLASVAGADELVVVDTSLPGDPPDRTREIALDAGARVFSFPWRDDFAAARNYALAQCTGDWVLVIDADEVLEPGGIDKLRGVIADVSARPVFFASDVRRTISFRTVAKSSGQEHRSVRAFRRCPEVYWQGAIHNHLSALAEYESDVVVTYGYSEAHKNDPDRALRILEKEMARDPTLVREAYYLAREYWYRRKYETAVRWYDDYLSRAKWAPEIADACLMKARCLWMLRRGQEARQSCLQAIGINPNFGEALRFMGEMSWEKNRKRWNEIAETASNEGVLFVRAPQVLDAGISG